jgi:peptidoglycan/xylan/chitin deacetylase (PgdA/CDA1 family)
MTILRQLSSGLSRKAARHYCSKPFRMTNRVPLASFTFDDVPDSAYANGASILSRHGVRGTFYIAAGTCGSRGEHWNVITREQVRCLHLEGHEIGCHTHSHADVETLDAAGLERECRDNEALLRQICGPLRLSNFCYPFGRVSLPRKLQLQRRFQSCRGVYQGVNSGTVDLALLRVIELYDRTLTPEKLERVLSEAVSSNGWVIFYTHDVADPPSWIGCSPALMSAVVQAVQAREGLQRIGVPGEIADAA